MLTGSCAHALQFSAPKYLNLFSTLVLGYHIENLYLYMYPGEHSVFFLKIRLYQLYK